MEPGEILVEHAHLDARAADTLLLRALGLRRGAVILISPDAGRLRWQTEQWIPGAKWRRCGRAGHLTIRLWSLVIAEQVSDIPPVMADLLLVADAHRFAGDPRPALRDIPSDRVLAGAIAAPGHWWHEACRETPDDQLLRLDAEAISQTWPGERDKMLLAKHRDFARHMQLDLTPPRRRAFAVTARERYRIRSDKPAHALSPYQRAAAEEAVGLGWDARDGARVLPLDLARLQRRYLAWKRHARKLGFRHILLLKYRRGGYTTLEQALSYDLCVHTPRSYVASVAHTSDATKKIFQIATMLHDEDPDHPALTGDSKSALEFANGSRFFLGTAGSKGFSRGDGLQRYHGSEVSRWCRAEGSGQIARVDDLVAGILGAAEHGEGVLETTAAGREWFHREWQRAKSGTSIFYPIFLPWFADPRNRLIASGYDIIELQDTLTDSEKVLVERHKLGLDQVAWRRQERRRYGRLSDQEIPDDDVSCFLAAGDRFFDPDIIRDLLFRTPGYATKHVSGGYEVEWEPPLPGVEYVVGCDTSEGVAGGDPSGVGILRRDTGAQVAAAHGLWRPRELAEIAVRMARRYSDALLGVERENHGHAVIQAVEDLGYGRPHTKGGPLYYHPIGSGSGARPGWSTNAVTRPLLLDGLAEWVAAGAPGLRDRQLLDEMGSFGRQATGKYEADSGAHDDTIMKWGIAWQLRMIRKQKPGILILGTGSR